jgi:hypothetical protein
MAQLNTDGTSVYDCLFALFSTCIAYPIISDFTNPGISDYSFSLIHFPHSLVASPLTPSARDHVSDPYKTVTARRHHESVLPTIAMHSVYQDSPNLLWHKVTLIYLKLPKLK